MDCIVVLGYMVEIFFYLDFFVIYSSEGQRVIRAGSFG